MHRAARFLPVLLVALTVAMAGCFGSGSDDTDDGSAEANPESTGPADGGAGGPAAPGSPTGSLTVDAPAWAPGQWWTWEVEGRDVEPFALTTVVAQQTEDGYRVGMSELEPGLFAHILHVPPLGLVDASSHAWDAHHAPTALLEFPLFDGKTWTGEIEEQPLDLSATLVQGPNGPTFQVNSVFTEFDGQGPRFVYDTSIGTFSSIDIHYGGDEPFASARVVASGTGFQGEVHVPHGEDKLLAGWGGPESGPNAAAEFSSPAEKAWLVFACYLGGDLGHYEITFVTPSPLEEPLTCSFDNNQQGFANAMDIQWRSSVPGDWNILFTVLGNGYAEAEVIGVWEQRCTFSAAGDECVAS